MLIELCSDDGAAKRFGNKFHKFPLVTCIKIREKDKRIVKIKEGVELLSGAHVFIVDDLVKTGGTLIECKNALLEHGAGITLVFFVKRFYRKGFCLCDSCSVSTRKLEKVC